VKYLDTIVTAHSPPPGSNRHTYSPWLFLDAAHVLFQTAKSRVYEGKIGNDAVRSSMTSLPTTLRPVLEEQPKWEVLAEVLEEIEINAYLNPMNTDESNKTVLIMCTDQRICRQLREYLGTMHTKVENESQDNAGGDEMKQQKTRSADVMLRRRLREYIDWKRSLSNVSRNLSGQPASEQGQPGSGRDSPRPLNPQGRPPSNKRRRVRGGGAVSTAPTPGRAPNASVQAETEPSEQMSDLLNEIQPTETEETQKEEIIIDDFEEMEDFYELYDMDDLVVLHPYDGDVDEHILEEVRPRYIIMYEPDPAFIRRVEVYRSSHVGRKVRVYFMYYGGSVEEQRYLSAVRREKDSFTKLIKEKSVRRFPNPSLFHKQVDKVRFFLEYGCNNNPRQKPRGPPRTIPPNSKYSYCWWWPPHSNSLASACCSGRSGIQKRSPFSFTWQQHGHRTLPANSWRLYPHPGDLR